MIRFLPALLFVVACGTDPSATEETKTVGTDPGENIERQPAEPRENVVEYRKDGERIALALEDTADLPACALDNEAQLAWIKSTEEFFACTQGTWVQVPVKGKDGAGGAAGTVGPAGPKGDKGDPGTPAVANQWFDPMTEDSWIVGAAVSQGPIILNGSPCAGDYRAPTSAEVQTAVLHGLSIASVAFGGAATFWSSDSIAEPLNGDQVPVYVNASGVASMSNGAAHGVACIAKGEVGE